MRPKSAKCLYDFEATEDNELSFVAGDVIVVTNNTDPNWWCGSDQGGKEVCGLCPCCVCTWSSHGVRKGASKIPIAVIPHVLIWCSVCDGVRCVMLA